MKRFIKIPAEILQYKLSPLQLLIYSGIVSYKSKENFTVATANSIAKRCHISRNSVYSALSVLENCGIIKRRHFIKNGKKSANGYYIKRCEGKFIKLEYSIFSYALSPSAFAVYLTLKRNANHANRAFPSLNQISNAANICIDTVIASIRKLSNAGLLFFKHYIRKCGCYGHNNYIVIEKTCTNETSEEKIIKLPLTKEAALKKAASFFNNFRYSKFWATKLDLLKNDVRKRIYSIFNTIRFIKLKV